MHIREEIAMWEECSLKFVLTFFMYLDCVVDNM